MNKSTNNDQSMDTPSHKGAVAGGAIGAAIGLAAGGPLGAAAGGATGAATGATLERGYRERMERKQKAPESDDD